MLHFQDIDIIDKEKLDYYLTNLVTQSCNYAFANLFSWRHKYHTGWCIYNNCLIIKFLIDSKNKIGYLQPIGNNIDSDIINIMVEDAASYNQPLRLYSMSKEFTDIYKQTSIGNNSYIYQNRDLEDYLYTTESLRTLSGKSLQTKRNQINQFKRLYKNSSYRLLNNTDKEEVENLMTLWNKEKVIHGYEINEESDMIRQSLMHFDTLDIFGIILYIDERAVAFSFGSYLNKKIFCVHAEKANTQYIGTYSYINQLLASHLPKDIELINREEDMGIMGLRKSKLSYYPEFLSNNYYSISKSDETEIWKLWKTCFGDSDEFISSYLINYSKNDNRILNYQGNDLAAMIHLHIFKNQDIDKIAYLYGLATSPQYRNKGFAYDVIKKSLLKLWRKDVKIVYAIQENKDFNAWSDKFDFTPYNKSPLYFRSPEQFDFGTGIIEQDFGMYRIMHALDYLNIYTAKHPSTNAEFYLSDSLFTENNGTYSISNGIVEYKPIQTTSHIMHPQDIAKQFPPDNVELEFVM
ncbi:MAG: GNAT family N-acetyltransferase [Bacteroidia bacterium]|nr:GNAT family N-acetyltransferase [Bacteroidia bacterium]